MAIYYNDILLNKLSFDDENSVFILEEGELKEKIVVNYIPQKINDEFDVNEYELFVFENNSLIAENDIFVVYEETLAKNVGWIFPISVLESNDNKYAKKDFFNQFRFLAYQKILSNSFSQETRINKIDVNETNLLSDLFENSLIILLLSKVEFETEYTINIDDYLPGLATYGYFIKNENQLIYSCPKDYIIDNFRGKSRIKISRAKSKLFDSDYSKKLYKNYLKTFNHHLIRFHLLYQIIEFRITEIFNVDFDILLEKFNNSNISKNDFIESINRIRNEREKIRKVLNNISPNDGTFEKEILINLKSNASAFLTEFGDYDKNEVGDLLYDIRNILVHNYRKIKEEDMALLNEITFEFEILINYLMRNST